MARSSLTYIRFLAHLAFRPCELLPSLFVRRPDWLGSFRGEDFFLISSPLVFIFSLAAILVGSRNHNFQGGPPKDHSTKVWLQLAQWFLRRRLKCDMLTDGRQTKSDGNSSHGLKARSANQHPSMDFDQTWYILSP
jgi:hypothetical protein